MRHIVGCSLVCILLCGDSQAAQNVSVSVTEVAYATVDNATEVDYYAIEFSMPVLTGGRFLTQATLELYMDVSSTLPDSISHGLATIEVALMPVLVSGRIDLSSAGTIAKRTVRVGSGQTVRVYITDALLEASGDLQSPVKLLVGAISGGRYGRFNAYRVPGASGDTKAVLTLHTQAPYPPGSAGAR